METQIFGDFIEERKEDTKYLKIGFSSNDLPLKRRWRTNGLSADFIADYLEFFFVGTPVNKTDVSAPIPAWSKNAVKYVANELLENAMKFSAELPHYPNRIAFHLGNEKLVFHVVNSIKPQDVEKFQESIKQILDEEPQDLYFRRMEDNADSDKNSGLGLLSMICDYGAQVGWKFETLQTEPPLIVVTTMVCLNI